MKSFNDFLQYVRSIKSAVVIDCIGSLCILLFIMFIYKTNTYRPMLPGMSVVGVQFVFSGCMVASKLKGFLKDFEKQGIVQFNGGISKLIKYFIVKAALFISSLLAFGATKMATLNPLINLIVLAAAYFICFVMSLFAIPKLKAFIKETEDFA